MGYKKVINERQEEMGEDNNSFGGYQPTEDRIMVSKVDSMIRIMVSQAASMDRIMASQVDSTDRDMVSMVRATDSREIHTDRIMLIRT